MKQPGRRKAQAKSDDSEKTVLQFRVNEIPVAPTSGARIIAFPVKTEKQRERFLVPVFIDWRGRRTNFGEFPSDRLNGLMDYMDAACEAWSNSTQGGNQNAL
jgi:hypothetical protein